MSERLRAAARLEAALRDQIRRAYAPAGDALAARPTSTMTREGFAALAREVLAFQATHNAAFARYCQRLGVEAAALADPLDAPPVPTDAFKEATLTTFPAGEAAACFRSSGTTRRDRGRHLVRELSVMRAAIEVSFRAYMLPDRAQMRLLILAPSAAEAPESSLYFMFDHLRQTLGAPGSLHLVVDGALDQARTRAALAAARSDDAPVFLLGPSFAYVHMLDGWQGGAAALPEGSRLFETGGFKGKSRRVPREALHEALRERLGLAPALIAGEYGMSELSSQLYEPCLRRHLAGATTAAPRCYVPPPWCATRVLDPETLTPLGVGEVGLIALLDLANVSSVAPVLTGDLGRLVAAEATDGEALVGWHGLPQGAGGLELLGRAADAAPKGCSLALDMLLEDGA